MADVRIARVGSYDDPGPVRALFRSALLEDPEIVDLLRSQDPSRLIVVKPNWIQESHELLPDVWEPVITHPRVVLAVVETLAELMLGTGIVCVCDAPHTHADFSAIVRRGGFIEEIDHMRKRWPRLSIEVLDLRREIWLRREGVIVERNPNVEDPRGYVRLDLGRDSLLHGHHGEGRYFGADYETATVNEHHRGDVQEYLLAASPLACDLFVNLPKLKTHKKTGISCCLKNLVGINGDKNWLPHHTESSPDRGGDEYLDSRVAHRIEAAFKKAGQRMAVAIPGAGTFLYRKARNLGLRVLGDSATVIRNGNWHGNDTCWRMALDLNRALLYGNIDGGFQDARRPVKRYVALVDGIVGGQGNGPLCPDPAASRVIFTGHNPAVVDAVAARLMGFDPQALAIVANAFATHRWSIADRMLDTILVADDRVGTEVPLAKVLPAVPGGFRPHFGWTGLGRTA